MRYSFNHLPFFLILFLILFLGATDLAAGVGANVLVTFLAPMLWLGLYVLGTHQPMREE